MLEKDGALTSAGIQQVLNQGPQLITKGYRRPGGCQYAIHVLYYLNIVAVFLGGQGGEEHPQKMPHRLDVAFALRCPKQCSIQKYGAPISAGVLSSVDQGPHQRRN